ncbi:MAG: site-specific DNA-methyltransferase, partial [Leptolyngbya sp. SIO1D8]|nr:site-specific DNA-methyltransferase [Leptolyngbya sp. SIO1D8]
MAPPVTLTNLEDLSSNKLQPCDRAFHDWYRFVLSFPPHLVRHYIQAFGLETDAVILDPFCGTGTTLVEAKKNKISSIGVEAIPMSHLASSTKIQWQVNQAALQAAQERVLSRAQTQAKKTPQLSFSPE